MTFFFFFFFFSISRVGPGHAPDRCYISAEILNQNMRGVQDILTRHVKSWGDASPYYPPMIYAIAEFIYRCFFLKFVLPFTMLSRVFSLWTLLCFVCLFFCKECVIINNEMIQVLEFCQM